MTEVAAATTTPATATPPPTNTAAAVPAPVAVPSAPSAVAAPAVAAATPATPAAVSDAPGAPPVETKPVVAEPPSLLGEPAITPFTAEALKLPEGFQLDDTTKGTLGELATKHKLSQEVVQAMVDLGASRSKAEAEAFQSSQLQAWKDTNDGWRNEIMADKELGGDKLDSLVRPTVSKMLDTLPNAAEFRQALNATGAGNHPAMVRALFHLAQQLTEGGPVQGKPALPKAQVNPAHVLYPNHSQTRQ